MMEGVIKAVGREGREEGTIERIEGRKFTIKKNK